MHPLHDESPDESPSSTHLPYWISEPRLHLRAGFSSGESVRLRSLDTGHHEYAIKVSVGTTRTVRSSMDGGRKRLDSGVDCSRLITRPRIGVVNHWTCSAACSGSSPSWHPPTSYIRSGSSVLLVARGSSLPAHMALP